MSILPWWTSFSSLNSFFDYFFDKIFWAYFSSVRLSCFFLVPGRLVRDCFLYGRLFCSSYSWWLLEIIYTFIFWPLFSLSSRFRDFDGFLLLKEDWWLNYLRILLSIYYYFFIYYFNSFITIFSSGFYSVISTFYFDFLT